MLSVFFLATNEQGEKIVKGLTNKLNQVLWSISLEVFSIENCLQNLLQNFKNWSIFLELAIFVFG